jgi:hypothetical protein
MRENDPSTTTNIKIKVYAVKIVSIANLNDFLRNNWLFTQTSKDPASNPETTPIKMLVNRPALGTNNDVGPREYGE